MGIQGLRKELAKNQLRKGHVSELAGKTVAVDASAWLHRGAFGCAVPLAMGQDTRGYVYYCVNLVNMLLHHKVTPILVFDGAPLPSKARTNAERTELRKANQEKGFELLKQGDKEGAEKAFQKGIRVTGLRLPFARPPVFTLSTTSTLATLHKDVPLDCQQSGMFLRHSPGGNWNCSHPRPPRATLMSHCLLPTCSAPRAAQPAASSLSASLPRPLVSRVPLTGVVGFAAEMAATLRATLKKDHIKCITAPYEADAQVEPGESTRSRGWVEAGSASERESV